MTAANKINDEITLIQVVGDFLSDLNSVVTLSQKTKSLVVTNADLKKEIESKIKEKKATDITDFFGVNIADVYSKSGLETKRAIVEHLLKLIGVSNGVAKQTLDDPKTFKLVQTNTMEQRMPDMTPMGMMAQFSQMGIDIPQLMANPEIQQMAPSLMSILQPDLLNDPQAIMKVANGFGQQLMPGFNLGTLVDVFEKRFNSGAWTRTDQMENADFLIMIIGDPEVRPIINKLPLPKFANKNGACNEQSSN